MDYFEAIEDYLEAESIVTAQWLANEIGISSDKASSLLQDYEAQNTGKISKSYVMMGYDNDNHLSCQIVHDQGSHKFDRVLYQKLYSIQKSSSNQVNTLMVHSILRQAEAMLLQDSLVTDRNSFVYNGLGPIRNSSIQIKNFGERVFSEQNLHFKRALSTSGMTLKSIPSMTKPKENVPVTNSVVTQAANAFFNKTATIKPVNAPAVPTPVETLPVPAPKPVENKSGEKRKLEKKYQSSSAMDDSEDEEWDVEIESNKKAKLNNEEPKVMDVVEEKENVSVAKNVPETVESDEGDEGDEEEDEVDENDENKNENKEKKPRKKRSSSSKKKNLHVHGAMDDFMEEAAVEKFKQEQQHQQEQGNQIPVRKMKKVLVEKVRVNNLCLCVIILFLFYSLLVHGG